VIALLLSGCVLGIDLQQQLDRAEASITQAHRVYAPLCAPVPLARAQANLDFARLELATGDPRRASQHLDLAEQFSGEALALAQECGGADADGDQVVDIVDRCLSEAEDRDGVDDDDGCPDRNPGDDEDGDGIPNYEDACFEVAEDRDGVNDEDGCPETEKDADGDGVVDVMDACEDAPEDKDNFQDLDGCPETDNDKDTIIDFVDRCPDAPEDRDGWKDDDGCPEADNDEDGVADADDMCRNVAGPADRSGCPTQDADNDGVADASDQCPEDRESANDYLDEDGCPDTPVEGIRVTSTQVEVQGAVKFRSGSEVLLPESWPLLNSVVQVLKDAPQLRIRIEGHTDGEGTEDGNLELSRERAVSVMKYLVAKGVDAQRLEAMGYGETRPIDTNRTPDGRARNRRVEFHIVGAE
jgi:OmpA-OmpF porin, OOP family